MAARAASHDRSSKPVIDNAMRRVHGVAKGNALPDGGECTQTDLDDSYCCDQDDLPHLHRLLEEMRAASLSTEFSGIDTPATAFMMIGASLCQELRMDASHVPSPANMFAVELSAQAREELLRHPHCPDHVYGDINNFWRPHVASQLDNLLASDEATDRVLLPLMQKRQATSRKAWCFKHGRMCEADRAAHLHVAGTPCTDWSQRGLMQKAEGCTWKAFLAWIARRWDYQEACLIQENVPLGCQRVRKIPRHAVLYQRCLPGSSLLWNANYKAKAVLRTASQVENWCCNVALQHFHGHVQSTRAIWRL